MAKKAEIVKNPTEGIQIYNLPQQILVLRDEHVLLDFQLAKLYGVETRVLKQAVKRNIERFTVDFMFRLIQDETNMLISNRGSQSVIPHEYNFGGNRLCCCRGAVRGRTKNNEKIKTET